MSLMMPGCILMLILVISMLYEPRSFWNALLLMMAIGIFLLGFGSAPGIRGMILGILTLLLIPLTFLVTAIFLIVNGFEMMKKEGGRLQNVLSLLTGIAMILGSILTIAGIYFFQDTSVKRTLFSLVLILEFYIAFTFASLLIYSLIYTCLPKRLNCDYIIVHGCGLIGGERVSPLLKGRVDKAVYIYHKCRQHTKIVVSGGKGVDEKISEAAAMKNYLVETGFPEDDIILEEQSKTTFENLKNVRDMLNVNGVKHRYIFVTNNYHVFRTSLYAKKLKMKASGVGCGTAAYYWPSAFIREYIAIMFRYKWIFAAIVLLWGMVVAKIYF
ncbi:YdcF family protein [Clostridium sp. JS66]|uniref:YdcF family protein n=1 Tax=Clostridium sp. JS66 TaxID=3064705 RepID=UPI00298EA389|nr:YdcF family protein [Clostridium sp. JS66]WPC43729.1 YdcF family protein [Clostridium sp. JS66]